MSEYAWVTLATNDSYSLGAMVLAHSLRQVGTSHQLVCIVTNGISDTMRTKLESVFDIIFEVNILDSRDEANLLLMQRPELGVTFTKLHCWRLTQFKKCVFLDADTLVLQNCDELFDREEFSAAPDVGWPDCFNSGVFVFQPSEATYESLIKFALENRSFDGGDQGLLNLYFCDWAHKDIGKHLPFLYNMCSTACYSYLPAFKQFGDGMKIIHFIGATKPWLQYFNSETLRVNVGAGMEHLQKIVQLWWDIFCTHVHKMLCADMGGIAGALAQISLGQPRTESQSAFEDHMRKQSWEVGNIDYMGRDRFDNIWSKISETLCSASSQPTPKQEIVQKRKKSPSPRPKQTTPTREVPVKEPPKQTPTPPKQEQPVKEPVAQEKKQGPPVEKPVAAVEKKSTQEQKQPSAKSTATTTQAKKPVESLKSSEPPKTSKLASSKAQPVPVESPTSPAASVASSPGAASPVSPTPPPRKTTQTQKKVPKKK